MTAHCFHNRVLRVDCLFHLATWGNLRTRILRYNLRSFKTVVRTFPHITCIPLWFAEVWDLSSLELRGCNHCFQITSTGKLHWSTGWFKWGWVLAVMWFSFHQNPAMWGTFSIKRAPWIDDYYAIRSDPEMVPQTTVQHNGKICCTQSF